MAPWLQSPSPALWSSWVSSAAVSVGQVPKKTSNQVAAKIFSHLNDSFLNRSPQERPIWCTQTVCAPTPRSTSTCLLSTRWLGPSCSELLLARRSPTWQSSPSAVLVQISYPCVTRWAATDTCWRSTARENPATWPSPGELLQRYISPGQKNTLLHSLKPHYHLFI